MAYTVIEAYRVVRTYNKDEKVDGLTWKQWSLLAHCAETWGAGKLPATAIEYAITCWKFGVHPDTWALCFGWVIDGVNGVEAITNMIDFDILSELFFL